MCDCVGRSWKAWRNLSGSRAASPSQTWPPTQTSSSPSTDRPELLPNDLLPETTSVLHKNIVAPWWLSWNPCIQDRCQNWVMFDLDGRQGNLCIFHKIIPIVYCHVIVVLGYRRKAMALALRLVTRNLLTPSCGSLSPLTYRAMATMKPMSAEVNSLRKRL